MKNIIGLLLCGFLCFWGGALWADTPATCPDKVLDIGTVEGAFLEIDEGPDSAYVLIKLDNGDDFYLDFDGEDEDFQRLFSQTGRRVSVSYNLVQYWHEGGESCMTEAVLVKGRLVEASASKPKSKQTVGGSQPATSGGSIADIMGGQR